MPSSAFSKYRSQPRQLKSAARAFSQAFAPIALSMAAIKPVVRQPRAFSRFYRDYNPAPPAAPTMPAARQPRAFSRSYRPVNAAPPAAPTVPAARQPRAFSRSYRLANKCTSPITTPHYSGPTAASPAPSSLPSPVPSSEITSLCLPSPLQQLSQPRKPTSPLRPTQPRQYIPELDDSHHDSWSGEFADWQYATHPFWRDFDPAHVDCSSNCDRSISSPASRCAEPEPTQSVINQVWDTITTGFSWLGSVASSAARAFWRAKDRGW